MKVQIVLLCALHNKKFLGPTGWWMLQPWTCFEMWLFIYRHQNRPCKLISMMTKDGVAVENREMDMY